MTHVTSCSQLSSCSSRRKNEHHVSFSNSNFTVFEISEQVRSKWESFLNQFTHKFQFAKFSVTILRSAHSLMNFIFPTVTKSVDEVEVLKKKREEKRYSNYASFVRFNQHCRSPTLIGSRNVKPLAFKINQSLSIIIFQLFLFQYLLGDWDKPKIRLISKVPTIRSLM